MNRGFTLIETIIYLALFALVVGGGMVAVYQIISSTDATNNKVILQEEANFLLRKIDNTLTGAVAVSVSSSPPTLVVTKSGPQTFASPSNDLTLNSKVLTSGSIKVSNLTFERIPGSGGRPDMVVTSFTLTTNQNGRASTQNFSTTKYLRL
jgi:type II secretory pathway pseudopilin PulG